MNDIVDRLRANGPGFGFYDHRVGRVFRSTIPRLSICSWRGKQRKRTM